MTGVVQVLSNLVQLRGVQDVDRGLSAVRNALADSLIGLGPGAGGGVAAHDVNHFGPHLGRSAAELHGGSSSAVRHRGLGQPVTLAEVNGGDDAHALLMELSLKLLAQVGQPQVTNVFRLLEQVRHHERGVVRNVVSQVGEVAVLNSGSALGNGFDYVGGGAQGLRRINLNVQRAVGSLVDTVAEVRPSFVHRVGSGLDGVHLQNDRLIGGASVSRCIAAIVCTGVGVTTSSQRQSHGRRQKRRE